MSYLIIYQSIHPSIHPSMEAEQLLVLQLTKSNRSTVKAAASYDPFLQFLFGGDLLEATVIIMAAKEEVR